MHVHIVRINCIVFIIMRKAIYYAQGYLHNRSVN